MEKFLGLDLGATNTKMVLLGLDAATAPAVEDLGSMATRGEEGHDAVITRLVETCDELASSHGGFTGVGIGTPGLFDEDGVVTLFTNLPGQWKGVELRRLMTRGVQLPVTLINDARAFTLAEGTLGAGAGYGVVVCMTLGTGVGGGIMIDGRPFFGSTRVAGEIAHQTVDPEGPICGCGNRGCAEAMARADVICAAAGRSSVEEVVAGAAGGDQRCNDAIVKAADALGIALANAITLLGPDRIVIGGGVAAAGEAILGPIRTATFRHVTLVPHGSIDIVPGALGPAAGAIGAALAAADAARDQTETSVTDQPPS